jgi:hypothetical protein
VQNAVFRKRGILSVSRLLVLPSPVSILHLPI